MKFTYLTQLFALSFILFISTTLSGQVTIGSNEPPIPGALLDLKNAASNKGMGMPRVALTKAKKLYPMFWDSNANAESPAYTADEYNINQEHTGLLVYNVTKNLAQNLDEGMYVWDGIQWTPLFEVPDPLYSPNSYFVKPNTTGFEIPVHKAYAVWENYGARFGTVDFDNATTFEAKVLWQQGNLISNHDGSANFLLPLEGEDGGAVIKINTTGNEGNASVGFFVDGVIRWSWHIWVTNYEPDNGDKTHTYNNGYREYVWMDRNLGATSPTPSDAKAIGLYYTWGRKDPFPFVVDFAGNRPTNLTGANVPDYQRQDLASSGGVHSTVYGNSITHPWAYLSGTCANGSLYDVGCYTGVDLNFYNDIWGQTSNRKSPFDPCPEGWAVPRVPVEIFDAGGTISASNWPFLYNGLISGGNADYGYTWDKGAVFGLKADFQLGYIPATGNINSWWMFGEPYTIDVGARSQLHFAYRGFKDNLETSASLSISNGNMELSSSLTGGGMNVRCVKE